MKYILLLILIALGAMLSLSLFSRKTPDNLGVADHRLSDCPDSKNCVSSQTTRKVNFIEPLPMQGTVAEVVQRLREAIEDMGGAVVETNGGYIRAEFSSSFWRFTDDLECLYSEKDGLVHVRSASRVGYFDFNANRNRLEILGRKVTVESAQ
ncbi:DUF1499 domain-containing protein [Pseudodesulfovibrio portus]|nr:DUF1499 domain-containing protein [Pseudodesulfovibrio portus]